MDQSITPLVSISALTYWASNAAASILTGSRRMSSQDPANMTGRSGMPPQGARTSANGQGPRRMASRRAATGRS